MTKKYSGVIISILIILVFNGDALSWDNGVTHRDISQYAAGNSVLSPTKGDYLKNLGLNAGLDEKLKWYKEQTVKEWIQDGAEFEDAGNLWQLVTSQSRSFNHFHNPLKQYPWTDAGLDDWIALPPFHTTGESSLLWAQDSFSQQSAPKGDWSWQTVRSYYYFALTSSADSARQENFAKTFEGLGHQMHLIQDAGQPDHVRNNAHVLDGGGIVVGLETWAKKKRSTINSFAANPIYPNVPFIIPYNDRVPITQLIDTDQYDGLNASASINQGLAEYTNANFFSDDTIFAAERYSTDDRHYFPFPRETSTDLADFLSGTKPAETFVDRDGNTRTGTWISKVRDGEYVQHFLKTNYLTRTLYHVTGESGLFYATLFRDEACHNDYAALLIPRAVGYSAGLLNYFFRGNIDITVPTNGLYSTIDATQPGFNPASAVFTNIKLFARNTTSTGEEMTDGSIQLVVKYKVAQTDPFQPGPIQTSADFTYFVVPEQNNIRALSRTSYTELNFDLGENGIPLRATDVYLQVVYHGILGGEDGAVAVGFKDISEPTPMDFFSNTDMICINGSWYVAGSPEAIAQVDANHNGIADYPNEGDVYGHDPKDIYVLFSPYSETIHRIASPTFYDFKVSDIAAGTHMRPLYVLSDYQFDNATYVHWVKRDSADPWTDRDVIYGHLCYGIKRQVDFVEDSGLCGGEPSCDIPYYPVEASSFPYYETQVFYTFRGARMWWGSPQIFTNGSYPSDSQCSFDIVTEGATGKVQTSSAGDPATVVNSSSGQ
jgi:hypothetical protein